MTNKNNETTQEQNKTEYADLVYFGFEGNFEQKFKAELSKRFKSVSFKDAYNVIKGHRQEVYLPKEEHKNYFAWIIAHGWVDASFLMNLMMYEPTKEMNVTELLELAKSQYPDNFKKSREN